MVKPIFRTAWGVCTLAFGLAALDSQAITQGEGRAIFAQNGCTECHAYVGQIGAPSAKQMARRFAGDSGAVSTAYSAVKEHAAQAPVSGDGIRLIAEWLGGSAPTAPAVPPPSVSGAPAVAALDAKLPTGGRRAVDESDKRKEAAAARAAKKQEAAATAKREAELRAALKREADERARQAAESRARRLAEEQATLKREAEERAKRAAEAKAKREAEVQAAQKREAEEHARRLAEAKAKNDQAAQEALKRDAEDRARRETEAKERREAEERAAAKREQEEQARRAAEAKARREAEEQVALKREADERLKREAELKARQEAEARARREAEAKAKKDAEAKVAAKDDGEPAGKGKGGKAPEKFRDEPCPPLAASAPPIGPVDEERAKQIMERIDCSGCHAYVQKKTGPPFKRVFEKVKGNPECVITRLKKSKEHNDEGVTDEIKGPEFKIVADYLATRAK